MDWASTATLFSMYEFLVVHHFYNLPILSLINTSLNVQVSKGRMKRITLNSNRRDSDLFSTPRLDLLLQFSKQNTTIIAHFFCLTVCLIRRDLLSPSTLFVMDLVITLLVLVMMDMSLILPPVLSGPWSRPVGSPPNPGVA